MKSFPFRLYEGMACLSNAEGHWCECGSVYVIRSMRALALHMDMKHESLLKQMRLYGICRRATGKSACSIYHPCLTVDGKYLSTMGRKDGLFVYCTGRHAKTCSFSSLQDEDGTDFDYVDALLSEMKQEDIIDDVLKLCWPFS